MRTNKLCLIAVIAFGLLAMPMITNAAWVTVDGRTSGDGIDYQMFNINIGSFHSSIHVTRMPINNTNYAIQACSAFGSVADAGFFGNGQKISQQIQRYDGAINSIGSMNGDYWEPTWGKTSKVIAAINGGPHDTGASFGVTRGHIQQGYYAKRIPDTSGLSGFFWGGDSKPYIGGCVDHGDQKAYFAGLTRTIARVNEEIATGDELVMYTPQSFDGRTPVRGSAGKEVVVRFEMVPNFNTGCDCVGTVEYVGNDYGLTVIPFDCIALSGSGVNATALSYLSAGNTVTIDQNVTNLKTEEQDPGYGCTNPDSSIQWDKAYAYVGGFWRFLENSTVKTTTNDTAATYRTAVAYNDSWVYFVTGRGLTLSALGNFCEVYLSATDGISLDNGSSTQMWVDGAYKFSNINSLCQLKGAHSPVADGLMMCKIEAEKKSTRAYDANSWIPVVANAYLRTGPGWYPIVNTLNSGTTVTNIAHPKNGIWSRGDFWRYVKTSTQRGWVAESALSCCYTLWDPEDRTVSIGTEAQFGCWWLGSVATRQWYKYTGPYTWEAVYDMPGHISGSSTNCLKIQVQAGDAGQYRCGCTSGCGDRVYSNYGTLTIN